MNPPVPGDDRIHVVISAFRPEPALVASVTDLRGHVDEIVVVDDGSGPDADDVLERIEHAGATVLRSPTNSGIASALNRGIDHARASGATHVLTLDQDSRLPAASVGRLLAAAGLAVGHGHAVAFAVPERFASVSQVAERHEDGTLFTRHAIQSGMLVPMATFDRVGTLRADLFIDLVDTEFELRCTTAGLRGIAAQGVRLPHSLGAAYERPAWLRAVTLGRGPKDVTLSTPFRYYYRVRNRIVVNREFRRTQPAWIARDTAVELLHFIVAATLARPRRSLWRVYRAAVSDARAGRMGRGDEATLRVARGIRWATPRIDRPDDQSLAPR
ncbi:glycosyltransferase [Agromyces salentinus]|uniref:Glycosyltransferase family 2 protein n=1 Tax=Agromyces salentinus TaxID=269421 RepID=A0ABP4Z4M9_9MICO|nr:glycosyltransferase [Agromyces salentinus]